MDKRVYITSDNFRQGYGQEGILLAEDNGKYIIQYQDDLEKYLCILQRDDFEFIDGDPV